MVLRNFRGTRADAAIRKLQSDITRGRLGRDIFNSVRRGDSQTSMLRKLRDKGTSVGRDTLNRFIGRKYSFERVVNFDAVRRARTGGRGGLPLNVFGGLYQAQDILLKVTLRLGDGSVRTFNRYVRNFEGQTLSDIYAEIETTYGETNQDADTKGEILNIAFA